MKARAVLCGVMLTMAGLSVGAGEKISLKASPEISYAPAHLVVRTAIEPDRDNRALEIVIDSQDFYRSSLIQLDGDQAPRASVVEFRGVPRGNYEISARLLGQSGESRGYERRMVNVIGNGDR
jgi:hypothetical protein